jgi:hypothetical protein
MTSAAGGTPEQRELQAKILAERDKGNVVFWGLPGELMTMPIEQIVKQDANGLLYDLNRLEEISLTFLADPKWVNDFAVALVIRKLIEQRDALASQPVSPGDGTEAWAIVGTDEQWTTRSWWKRAEDAWRGYVALQNFAAVSEEYLKAQGYRAVRVLILPSPPNGSGEQG